jgi:hypothetical protein
MKTAKRIFTILLGIGFLLLVPFITSGQEQRHDIPLDHAVFRGPADAPITIIEFLDFQ